MEGEAYSINPDNILPEHRHKLILNDNSKAIQEEVIAIIYKIRAEGLSYLEIASETGGLINQSQIFKIQRHEWWPQSHTRQMEIKTLIENVYQNLMKKQT